MNYNYPGNKIIIYCAHCLNKLRVPSDRGKISVKCPACGKDFIYNPGSVVDTLKQIALLTRKQLSKLIRKRR